MAKERTRRCSVPGCNKLCHGARCTEHAHRETYKSNPIYNDRRWRKQSRLYLKQHPLCVSCMLRGRVQPAQAVDHIIPHQDDQERFWNQENWAASCRSCNAHKASWEHQLHYRNDGNVVLCGLPATGKSTLARAMGLPTWDMDEEAERQGFGAYPRSWHAQQILMRQRGEWIREQRDRCVVIAAHPHAACKIAAACGAIVRHVVCSEIVRQERIAERRARDHVAHVARDAQSEPLTACESEIGTSHAATEIASEGV